MNWFRNLPVLVAVLALGTTTFAAKKDENGKPVQKSAKGDKGDKGSKGDKKAKDAPDSTPAPDANKGRISVPVPPGHDAKGLVIPYRDAQGNMQMRFTMEVGNRTDVDHMDMTTLLIETFDDEGKGEMTIDLPQSILDLNTRVITTESGVVIKRADFELTGKTMEFNTETRAGKVGGNVRMLIYNLENETDSDAEGKPSAKK
jgi:hypothetical protein